MNKNLHIIFFVFLCHSCFAINNMSDKLLQIIHTAQTKFELPGIALTVLSPSINTQIFVPSGSAVRNENIPITKNTLFQVGSVTKTFTAMLLMQAVEDGKISLDDKVGGYLPEYSKWKDIKISELANQTSGVFDYTDSDFWWTRLYFSSKLGMTWDAKELADFAYKHDNLFEHGTNWGYSNTNYVLLGLILEKISNQTFTSLINNLIVQTGLEHTYYLIDKYPNNIMPQMARGYSCRNSIYDATNINGSWLQSAGAIVSTSSDLATWMQEVFKKQKQYNLKNIRNDIGYSLGMFRVNTPNGIIWLASGLTPGYTAIAIYAPCQNIYFAYTINKSPIDNKLHEYLINNILGAFRDDATYKKQCKNLKPADKFIFPFET